ncbi:STAS/SEC14 domain-containing protein [Polyangium aurulentum]|uniref:STAS/SEC14 domain-containing protein n=1 Tax=Polyangium aurulentum TaxID=2567896 RepID=UPI0010AE2B38|nr:STAS/SEC14 domain-containing protein [Polyangium aurulentum]UQA60360.1 STAS/SEC14 domain-containing protein [Polyangium aurulentum]
MTILLRAGQHVIEVEDRNLVIYRLRGILDGDDLRAMRRAQAKWMADKDHIVGLVDVTEMEGSTSDARKESMRPDGGTQHRALAYFGSRFAVRVAVELLLRALRIVRASPYPMRFCEDEASARAWLEEQRPELLRRVRGASLGGATLLGSLPDAEEAEARERAAAIDQR